MSFSCHLFEHEIRQSIKIDTNGKKQSCKSDIDFVMESYSLPTWRFIYNTLKDIIRPRLYFIINTYESKVFILLIIDMRRYCFIVIFMNAFGQAVHQCKIPYVFNLNSHDQLRKYHLQKYLSSPPLYLENRLSYDNGYIGRKGK